MEQFNLSLWLKSSEPILIDQICIDSRRISTKNSVFIALQGQRDGHEFVADAEQRGARYAIVEKGWQPTHKLETLILLYVDDTLRALQEIAGLYRRQLPCQVIAISGSYGKTMVKDLTSSILSTTYNTAASPESFNSQIGVALSLLTLKEHHEVAFIELAISKPGEMSHLVQMVMPDAAIITHLGNKHLTTLGSKEILAEELMLLLEKIPKNSWVLLPNDFLLFERSYRIQAKISLWDSSEAPFASRCEQQSSLELPYKIQFPDGKIFKNSVRSGFHYALDLIQIAIKTAWILNVPSNSIMESLEGFTPEPTRTEIWRSPSGITFINDCYCSDPQSIDCALKFYDHEVPLQNAKARRIFVFSGLRSNQSDNCYQRIGQAIIEAGVHHIILVGNHQFTPLCQELPPEIVITQVPTNQDAILQMQKSLQHGDLVLIKGERKIPLDTIIEAFNDSPCNNQCLINLEAIKTNIATIRHKLPKSTKIMVMVKAFAYGTDEVRMAKFLSRCAVDMLGVSYCDEAVALKRAGIKQEIFVINAATFEANKVVRWNLAVGVSDHSLIDALEKVAQEESKKVSVHLHVDTGMGRFGCRSEEALALAQRIDRSEHLILEGVMTHFATAEDQSEDMFTLQQAQTFDRIIQELKSHGIDPKWKHAANSSATLRFHFTQYNLVRIGLAAYGLHASSEAACQLELRQALTLLSRIVGINICKAGESISYGRSYKVHEGTKRIAVLPIGYFDGLHRHYSGKGAVIIRGYSAPMVGNICMDFMMVDITEIPDAMVGDPVLIFGQDEHGHTLAAEKLAGQGNSIVHELITCLGPRIPRIFIHEEN